MQTLKNKVNLTVSYFKISKIIRNKNINLQILENWENIWLTGVDIDCQGSHRSLFD